MRCTELATSSPFVKKTFHVFFLSSPHMAFDMLACISNHGQEFFFLRVYFSVDVLSFFYILFQLSVMIVLRAIVLEANCEHYIIRG
jgi:hypothetical protein